MVGPVLSLLALECHDCSYLQNIERTYFCYKYLMRTRMCGSLTYFSLFVLNVSKEKTYYKRVLKQKNFISPAKMSAFYEN